MMVVTCKCLTCSAPLRAEFERLDGTFRCRSCKCLMKFQTICESCNCQLKAEFSNANKRFRCPCGRITKLTEKRLRISKVKSGHVTTQGFSQRETSDPSGKSDIDPNESIFVRVPEDADDFETVCEEWMCSAGFACVRTPTGRDKGLDLVGEDIAGQCKIHLAGAKISAPDVQSFYGAAIQAGKRKMHFFHYGKGYTEQAVESAKSLGVNLWELDVSRMRMRSVYRLR